MTIDNKTRTCSIIIAAVLLSTSILVGCERDSAFDAVGEMLDVAKTEPVLECEVVYPKGSSAAVVMASRELADLLAEQTEMSVTAHQYEKKYDPEKIYVVIGRVGDDVTEYWYDGMKDGGYVCRVYKNTVAIGGMTDEATLTAIQRFIDEILPKAEYGYIAEEGVLFEQSGEEAPSETEESDKIMLNGCGLEEYEIVYTDNSLTSLVQGFGEKIEAGAKCSLNVFLRNPSNSKKEIIIRINGDVGEMKYRLYGYGDDVFVEADSIYGVSLAVDELLERMSKIAQDTKNIQIIGEELFSYVNYGMTVASYRIEKNVAISNKELKSVSDAIKRSEADVITVKLPSRNLWNALNMYFYDFYDNRLIDCPDGGLVAVLSRPNTVEIDGAVLKTEQGISVIEISLSCLDNKYRVLSLYLPEGECAESGLDFVNELYRDSDERLVCIVTTSKNQVMPKNFQDTENYLCMLDDTVDSGLARYEICVLISPNLDGYDKVSVADDEGRLVGVGVSVRRGIE